MDLRSALALDEAGELDRVDTVAGAIADRWRQTPGDLDLAARWLNMLTCTGAASDELRAAFNEVLAAYPADSSDVVTRFVVPAVACLLSLTEIGLASELLDRISDEQRTLPDVRSLHVERDKLEAVERGEPVPWERKATSWWQSPAQLPAEVEGQPLRRWMAARLDRREGDVVHLRVGLVQDGTVRYGWSSPTYEWWRDRGGVELPDEPLGRTVTRTGRSEVTAVPVSERSTCCERSSARASRER